MSSPAVRFGTTGAPVGSGAPQAGAPQAGGGVPGNGVAQRLHPSLVPAITGVRISPGEAAARLVNISSSGALVECEHRYNPGSPVTVHFTGTFTPADVPGRVARATVSGIGPTGALNYHIGIAFIRTITLPDPATPGRDTPPAVRPGSPPAPPPAPAAPTQPVLRNNW